MCSNRTDPDWFFWNGFAFPRMEGVSYQPDGPDKDAPDRLFIADSRERFLLYLEKGFDTLPRELVTSDGYETCTKPLARCSLTLCCPAKKQSRPIHTGYFQLAFALPGGKSESCTGSLSIAPPMPYQTGLAAFSELHTLFAEICPQTFVRP